MFRQGCHHQAQGATHWTTSAREKQEVKSLDPNHRTLPLYHHISTKSACFRTSREFRNSPMAVDLPQCQWKFVSCPPPGHQQESNRSYLASTRSVPKLPSNHTNHCIRPVSSARYRPQSQLKATPDRCGGNCKQFPMAHLR